jgi:hypothetical protein
MVGMRGRIGGLVCAGALLLAGEAKAAPMALLDAPRATAVALAGSEVLVGRPASRGAARIDAVPIGGGPVRAVARIPRPRPGRLGRPVVIASSAQLVAAVVEFYGERPIPARTQLWIGPPAGPLRREVDARFKTRAWLPVAVDVDGDRVLVVEARVPDLQFRARVLVPGAPPHVVPWRRYLRPPVALAGDRIAFVGVGTAGPAVKVVDWRTGALIERRPDGDVADLDFAADRRVVTAIEHEPFEAPRIAGDRIVAFEPSRFDATRPVLLDSAGGPPVPLGLPSTQAGGLAVDPSGAAWIANGCVLYAPLAGPPPTEPPPGACPRAEMLVKGVDATLRGRRLRFRVACVAAPAAGCSGTVLVRGDELPGPGGNTPIRGRGRFRVPAGTRRRVDVVLTRRSIPYVRAALRREHEASLAVGIRARDGRGYGDTGALIVRMRR